MNRKNCFKAALLCFLPFSAAFAQNNNDLAAYREAGSKLASLVAEAEGSAGEKRLQTEEVKLLVAVLSDEKRFLQPEQYSARELGRLLDLCEMSNRAVMSLSLFAFKKHIDTKAEPRAIALQVAGLMQKNAESFGGHLRYLQPFLIRCLAKQAPALTDFVKLLPPAQFTEIRREGLQKVRTGIAQLFVGVIQILGDRRNDEAYRLALVQALAESASVLISTLPLEVRLQIRALVSPVGESSPPQFAPYLKKIYEALDGKTCEGLCRVI